MEMGKQMLLFETFGKCNESYKMKFVFAFPNDAINWNEKWKYFIDEKPFNIKYSA